MTRKGIQYEWRVVPGFPEYEIATLGYIRKVKTGVLIAIHTTGNTETVQLTRNGSRYHRSVAALVRAAFPDVAYP